MRVGALKLAVIGTAGLTTAVGSQQLVSVSGYNLYGQPGLIDMPTATSRPDAELAFSSSYFAGQNRNTLTFQLLPGLSGSFRYSTIDNFRRNPNAAPGGTTFDRSFSIHYQLAEETQTRPAFAIGLNDFLGTGIYSSEYVVASKTFGNRLQVTGGMGWGRLGSYNSFDNPLSVISDRFDERGNLDVGRGGTVSTSQLFTGPAALFGGIEYQVSDRLRVMAEYSSDAYVNEDGASFDRKSPFNFGLSYDVRNNVSLSAYYLYGSEIGAMVTIGANPKQPRAGSGLDKAPPPVRLRSASELGWPASTGQSQTSTQTALEAQGLRLHGFRIDGRTAYVEIENLTYNQTAQAIGRAARALSGTLPRNVDTIVVTPVEQGLRGKSATIQRSDLEALEYDFDNSWTSFTRTQFDTAQPLDPVETRYPRFEYNLSPYFTPSLFDPDDPIRANVGVSLKAKYEIRSGLVVSGEVRQKIAGNLDESTRESTSVLPKVRSNFNIYDREGETALTNLQAAYYFDVAPDVTGRVTAGYLEPMFGGVSAEVLWSPENSPFSYGLEANYVKQRDFDQGFGFQDYSVGTGHASVYWDMGNGFTSQLDAGRYLAGDWGATIALDRKFNNGWEVGAFATFTDVSFDDFGEGSFDKGIRFTVPITWITGEPNRDTFSTTIRPVQRDGGARLNVQGRLHEVTRDLQKDEYSEGWGRFWR